MIRINLFIQVDDKNHEHVMAAAKELTEASLKEAGCIAYDVFQSETRSDILMICETWKDEATLETHKKTQVYEKNITVLQDFSAIKVEKFEF